MATLPLEPFLGYHLGRMHARTHDFANRFRGLSTAYGLYDIPTEDKLKEGKIKGRVKTITGKLKIELYSHHLIGKLGLGIVPICENNTCWFGAIDVDDYTTDHAGVQNRINTNKLPLVMCRTKSGGMHLYLFLSKPAPAKLVQEKLRSMASILGFGDCEVFPKQQQILVDEGDAGSWINLPYQQESDTTRYAYDDDARQLSLDEFLKYATTKEIDEQDLATMSLDPAEALSGGPVCLNRMFKNGGCPEGMRNNALLQVCTYAKKVDPDGWQVLVEKINNKFIKLQSTEVLGAIRSHAKKDYNYACNKEPFTSYCDRAACSRCKFGIRGDRGLPQLSSLSKLCTTPPLWFVDVAESDTRIILTTEQLENFRLFRKQCMEVLTVFPRMIKGEEWDEMLEKMMDSCVEIEVPPEATKKGMFMHFLEEFCMQYSDEVDIANVLHGQVWTSGTGKKGELFHHFRLYDLINYLKRMGFEDVTRNWVTATLKSIKAKHSFFKVKGKGVNLWMVPAFVEQDGPFTLPADPDEPF